MKMNRADLKTLMIICMTLDHLAYAFLSPNSLLYQLMRFFGRMVAPVMCYLLVEGFFKTSSRNKYLKRMIIWAFVSQVPYILMLKPSIMAGNGNIFQPNLNMLFTLALCLVMLMLLEQVNDYALNDMGKSLMRLAIIVITVYLSRWGDWGYFAPLYVAVFYLFRDDERLQNLGIILIGLTCWYYITAHWSGNFGQIIGKSWFCLGSFALIGIRYIYNHQPGAKMYRDFFYAYYGLHILVIDVIKYIVFYRR